MSVIQRGEIRQPPLDTVHAGWNESHGVRLLDLTGLLALAAGLGWASGVRLYASLFIVGVVGKMGWVALPEGLRVRLAG